MKKERPKRIEVFKVIRHKRKYSDMFKKNVIAYRFNSLTNISNPVRSKKDIVKNFKVPMTTVRRWCRLHTHEPGALWNKKRYKGKMRREFTYDQLNAMVSK